ncbi:hypothetical protein [Veillonella caviae]|uniref:hypothetical protein n=1 Tax=Veillonella caviae TaxID=248316 RepID=UPI0023F7A74D|nr:hypothetical protein [Veillonella caviae]
MKINKTDYFKAHAFLDNINVNYITDDCLYFKLPYIDSEIKIGCRLIDDMGKFKHFIFWCIAEGYSIQDIIESIPIMDEFIISDELESLKNAQLIDDNSRLSGLGDEYIFLIRCIDYINKLNIKISLNLLTGELREFKPLRVYEDNIQCKNAFLVDIEPQYTLKNINYIYDFDTQFFMKELFSKYIKDTMVLKKYLPYMYLKIINPSDQYTRLYSFNYKKYHSVYDNDGLFCLNYPLARFDFRICYNYLDSYRESIKKQDYLECYDSELINKNIKFISIEKDLFGSRINRNDLSNSSTICNSVNLDIDLSEQFSSIANFLIEAFNKANADEYLELEKITLDIIPINIGNNDLKEV